MKYLLTTIQSALTNIIDWLENFVGGYDGLFYTLIVFIVIDSLSGLMCTIVEKKLSPSVSIKGIFRKILIITLVGIGHILDKYVICFNYMIRTATIVFYISKEFTSLVKNIEHLDLQIPMVLKTFINHFTALSNKHNK